MEDARVVVFCTYAVITVPSGKLSAVYSTDAVDPWLPAENELLLPANTVTSAIFTESPKPSRDA